MENRIGILQLFIVHYLSPYNLPQDIEINSSVSPIRVSCKMVIISAGEMVDLNESFPNLV